MKKELEWNIIDLRDIKSLDNKKRKELTNYLLKNLNLMDVKVSTRKLGADGVTKSYPNKVVEVVLKSDDNRTKESMLKTIFHEIMHASAKGYANCLKGYMEEVFAETIGSFMVKKNGFNTKNIAISYMDVLPQYFDELKKFEIFSKCETVSDFGEVLEKLGREGIKNLYIKNHARISGRRFLEYIERYDNEEIFSPEVKKNLMKVQLKEYDNVPAFWESKYNAFVADKNNADDYFLQKILATLYTVKGVR